MHLQICKRQTFCRELCSTNSITSLVTYPTGGHFFAGRSEATKETIRAFLANTEWALITVN
jgi:hypothetical protein